MQTFLPYPSFKDSAKVLDRQRLGKQRVENLQILIAIYEERGYVHHPAVKMWVGYEPSLLAYQKAIVDEWLSRGYKDTCWGKSQDLFDQFQPLWNTKRVDPSFVGDIEFHISHQSNLVRKDPEYYGRRFPYTPDDIEYIWPTS